MIYITFKLNPRPCMSVWLRIFSLDILCNILVVAAPTIGFLDFAPTAIPITGAIVLIVEFQNLFQAVLDPLNIIFIVFLQPLASN